MLNLFPIQFLSLLAFLILRVFVGTILLYLGFSHIKKRHELKYAFSLPWFPYGLFSVWYLALIELIIGIMFIVGFYTQIAALVGIALSLKMLVFRKRFMTPALPGRLFYVLLFAASVSLFITGAGAFAFDLPI